jgi:hypothetical protein
VAPAVTPPQGVDLFVDRKWTYWVTASGPISWPKVDPSRGRRHKRIVCVKRIVSRARTISLPSSCSRSVVFGGNAGVRVESGRRPHLQITYLLDAIPEALGRIRAERARPAVHVS